MAAVKAFTVRAVRWKQGWELHIDGEGVTQVRTLDRAAEQVRDYLQSMHGTDFSDATVEVTPDLDGLEVEIAQARRDVVDAAQAQARAAARSRAVARELRRRGLSVTDTAAILGVSRGRVSQLVS